MRITDDRYARDRLRHDLALRLIQHEARTRTIRRWTGLTDDRIRKLYRSYVVESGRPDVRRHRGKSPEQSAFFMRNASIRREAAGLAAHFCLLGLLRRDGREASGAIDYLRFGEKFCVAYETFLNIYERPEISFEHACHLFRLLEKQNEISLDECAGCGSLLVAMLYAERPRACEFCATNRPPSRRTATASTSVPKLSPS